MSALKGRDIERFLERPEAGVAVCLVYGPDAGLVRENADRLIRHYAGADGTIVTLDAGDVDSDPSRLAVEARVDSLFGGRQVVRLRGTGRGLAPILAEILENPAEAVIVVEAGNLAPRDPVRALAESSARARALPCYADSEEQIGRLLRESFAKAGISVDDEALQALRDGLGNDREITRREIEKLVLYSAQSRHIGLADVQALSADNAALAMDAILDATGNGHAARLDTAIARAMAAGNDEQRLLTAALAHFSTLRRWRAQVDGGRSPREVVDNASPRPHFSRKTALEQQLRLWTDEALSAATRRLHLAIGESRKRPALAQSIMRRTLLRLALAAAER